MSTPRYKAAPTSSFLKALKRLPQDIKERALRAVDEILAEPHLGTKLRGGTRGILAMENRQLQDHIHHR